MGSRTLPKPNVVSVGRGYRNCQGTGMDTERNLKPFIYCGRITGVVSYS